MSEELVEAASDGDVDLVQDLLRAGVDPNAADADGLTPLCAAGGELDIVERLLEAGADPNGSGPPLVAAAWHWEPVVDALLAHGADVEATDANGATPLYAAAVSGEAGVVRRLLAAGADPNRPSDAPPLCAAACWGFAEVVAVLLAGGADPNLREDFGTSPLDWAVIGIHPRVAGALLAAGADPNADGYGGPPLVAAAGRGSIDLVGVLLEHGADVTATNADGVTALDVAESWVGKDVEAELREQVPFDASTDRVEVRREPRSGGSEFIEVSIVQAGGGRVDTSCETGHAQIVALLRGRVGK